MCSEKSARLLDDLFQLLANLRFDWEILRAAMYSKELVGLMNEHGSDVFFVFHHATVRGIVLEIAKLLDPASSGPGRENVCLAALLDELRLPTEIDREMRSELDAIRSDLEPIKRLRDKRIAHNDSRVLRGPLDLVGVAPDDITRAVDRVESVYRRARRAFNDTGVRFDVSTRADAQYAVDQLLRVLRAGNAALDRDSEQ